MLDRDQIVELLPHYAAMLIAVFIAIGFFRVAVGGEQFWVELGITAAIVFAYQPVVRRLGVAPSAWTPTDDPEP